MTFFLLALLKPRKVLWSLKSNAVSYAITTAQWKTDLLLRWTKTWITKGSSYCYFFVFLHKVRWRLVDRKIKQQLGNFSGNKLKKELWENYRDYFACYTSKVGHQKQQHIQLSRCCLLLSILVQVFFLITLSGLFNDNISTQWYVIRNVICLLNELL